MALKTFATLLLLSCMAGAAAGPMVCATCYTACIAGCWANGVAATAATLGVAAPAGIWGAAACSSMCAPTCACHAQRRRHEATSFVEGAVSVLAMAHLLTCCDEPVFCPQRDSHDCAARRKTGAAPQLDHDRCSARKPVTADAYL